MYALLWKNLIFTHKKKIGESIQNNSLVKIKYFTVTYLILLQMFIHLGLQWEPKEVQHRRPGKDGPDRYRAHGKWWTKDHLCGLQGLCSWYVKGPFCVWCTIWQNGRTCSSSSSTILRLDLLMHVSSKICKLSDWIFKTRFWLVDLKHRGNLIGWFEE